MQHFMKHPSFSAAWAFGLLAGLAGACSTPSKDASTAQASAPATPAVPVVEVLALAPPQSQARTVRLPGELLPREHVSLRAKISGYVRRLPVDIGSRVKKGQVLVVLEAPEAQARLAGAASAQQAAQARYQSSLDTYQRVAQASGTAGVIAASEVARTRNQMLADKSGVATARAMLRAVQDENQYLTVRAPFSGVVAKRFVDVGALVGSGDAPLLELEDNAVLRLNVAVPEAAAGNTLEKEQVSFTVKAFPGQPRTAHRSRQTQSLDVDTRSETWQFDVPNPDGALKPGMFADVQLQLSRQKPSFAVPFPTAVTTQERSFVIRVHRGRTEWVDVSKGISLAEQVEVFGKLMPGDTLVRRGSEELKPETVVKIKFAAPEAAAKLEK